MAFPHGRFVHSSKTLITRLPLVYLRVLLQVPANRIGAQELNLAQLKIMQEAITLVVFVPFAIFYMQQPLKLDYLWAALCILGAVYFIFRA